MKNVILICGSFTSANFYVMLSVIRALGEVHIHAISSNNEAETNLPTYTDVSYHHVYNWRKSFLNFIQKISNKTISRGIEYLFFKVTNLYDTLFTSKYERAIYRNCLEIMGEEKIDAVFSVCLRFYTHRIASKLHQETGVKWYQFWVDPYSNKKDGGRLWGKLARRVERNLLEATDLIYALPEVFVGSKLIESYKHKLISFEIPYLVEREIQQSTKDIIFAGGFIKGVREPGPVLDLLLSICDAINSEVRFHFYVQNKDNYSSYTNRSNGKILFHDYLSHEELYRRLSCSFMLLNIGNAGTIQMPSKTVEYVSFRKPMLFFYKDQHDPSLRYLEKYPDICRINVDDQIENNKQLLLVYLTKSHRSIEYSDLMEVDVYRESTPDYIKGILGYSNENNKINSIK